MNIINVQQGSAEWLDLRAKHFTASEAPAMLGLSKYKSRSELLREKATGITPEVDAATQALFNKGHLAESLARPMVEEMVGADLYPVTVTAEIEGLRLLASLDGLTMDETTIWENKCWNEEFAAFVKNGVVPDTHWPQLEHQLLVTGAESVLFTVSDGERLEFTVYKSVPERREQVIKGWEQFATDLAAYRQEPAAVPKPVGESPDQLPALRIELTGMVTASNLAEWKSRALAIVSNVSTALVTDQDFADAEKAAKWCGDAEKKIDNAKDAALSQTASIAELFAALDDVKAELRNKRLALEKLVKAEKEQRKAELVTEAHGKACEHVAALESAIGGKWIGMPDLPPFGAAIKGLKSLESMRDKLSCVLAECKIEANNTAEIIRLNQATLKAHEAEAFVPDFGHVCQKQPEDFMALIVSRKALHEEKIRQEEERIRAQAAAMIRAEEDAKARAEAAAKERKEKAEKIEAERLIEQAKINAQQNDAVEQPKATAAKPAQLPLNTRQALMRKFLNGRKLSEPDWNKWHSILTEWEKFLEMQGFSTTI